MWPKELGREAGLFAWPKGSQVAVACSRARDVVVVHITTSK